MNAAELILCLFLYSGLITTLLMFALGGNHNLAREIRLLKRKLREALEVIGHA